MPSSKSAYDLSSGAPSPVVKEEHIEYGFIGKLQSLKYEYRPDIRDRAALERNFREKFEALNRVHLSDGEFTRLLDEIVTPDEAISLGRERGSMILHPLCGGISPDVAWETMHMYVDKVLPALKGS